MLYNELAYMLLHADIGTPVYKMMEELNCVITVKGGKANYFLYHKQMDPFYVPTYNKSTRGQLAIIW